ncbi:MAG: asparagine synthetase B family protein [Gammaproteobacteria bacterium]
MPNLGGVFEPGLPTQEIKQMNDQQVARLRVRGVDYAEHRFHDRGIAVSLLDHGILENGEQPVVSADGRHVLFLDGELYNGAELRVRYRDVAPLDQYSDAELILTLMLAVGDSVLPHLNGLFVIVHYDVTRQRLRIVGDRYGFRPLFLRRTDTGLIFGSELKAIAAIDPSGKSLDELGILELFSFGHHVEDRTWLKDYKKLRPASLIEIDAAGMVESRYWHYAYDERAPTRDQQTYVTIYRTLMDRAVERNMRGRHSVGIFLSGGYDSRVVAASIRNYHLPVPSVTFGLPESRDVQYAGQLAERLGFDHATLHDSRAHLVNCCRAVVWRNEGMLPFASGTSIRFHADLKPRMDIILTGVLGELGGSHTWPRLLAARTRRATMDAVFDWLVTSRQPSVQRVFAPDYYARMREELRRRFDESFDEIQNDHPLNVADCYNRIFTHPRNTLQAPATDRYQFEVRAPHMDTELVDFLLTIPPWSRIEQRVYKKLIAYGYPQVRDIPCTNSTKPVDPVFLREYGLMAARAIGRKVTGPLKSALGIKRGLGREPDDLAAQFRAERGIVDDCLRPLLRDGVFPTEIFSHEGIDGLIVEHYEGGADHALLISLLVSWGYAAKWLGHGDITDAPSELFAGA